MKEPTIYDFVISLFTRNETVQLAPLDKSDKKKKIDGNKQDAEKPKRLRFIGGSMLAIFGQYFLEPANRNVFFAILLYIIAIWMIWTAVRKEQIQAVIDEKLVYEPIAVRSPYLIISLISQVAAFIFFKDNQFNFLNLFFWLIGIVTLMLAFWSYNNHTTSLKREGKKIFDYFLIIVALIIVFFRIYQINFVPGEMYSDHAEKLLDVMDIFTGKYPTFFERNTGREPFQFYMTALIIRLFKTGFTFLSLKIGTITFGLVTLPYIYLIGKHIGNQWTGLAAFFLAGVAYWPNVISRVGLRYALYPLFAAPALYYAMQGLSKKQINDFLLCGLSIGLGLLGYSSFRMVPIYIFIIILLAIIKANKDEKPHLVSLLIIIVLLSIAVFLPLLRYWFDHPYMFSYRSLTRLTQIEKPFDEPAWLIFVKNLFSSLIMPIWNNGHIWVHSIPNRPALDYFSGGFFVIGVVVIIKRIIHEKQFGMLIMLLSIPFLMLPSILSLAYPGENPSLNRSAAAYIPIFIIAGIGVYYFMDAISQQFSDRIQKIVLPLIGFVVAGIICLNNYTLVFQEYKTQFLQNAWNSSEIGEVIEQFLANDEEEKNAYVVPYAHWVDTRLVGFNAGLPGKDFALWRDDIDITRQEKNNKMFIYKIDDSETALVLRDLYPQGELSIFHSKVPGKEFITYTVLSQE